MIRESDTTSCFLTRGLDKGYTGGLFELTGDDCTLFTEAKDILNKKARQEFLRLYGRLPIATPLDIVVDKDDKDSQDLALYKSHVYSTSVMSDNSKIGHVSYVFRKKICGSIVDYIYLTIYKLMDDYITTIPCHSSMLTTIPNVKVCQMGPTIGWFLHGFVEVFDYDTLSSPLVDDTIRRMRGLTDSYARSLMTEDSLHSCMFEPMRDAGGTTCHF